MMEGSLDRSVVEAAVAQYGLDVDEITAVRFTNNAVFQLRAAEGDFALRIHRPGYRTLQQTRSELAYLVALSANSEVEAPVPILTRSGDLAASIETDALGRHCSVLSWVEGEVRRPGRGAGPKTLFRIGEALGRIHRFSESFDPPAGFDLPTWDLTAMLDPSCFGSLAPVRLRSLCDEVARRVSALFAEIAAEPASYGVIHHDFILLNCLHAGRQTVVIDFDDCGWGFYLQDLGGLLGNLKDYDDYRSLRRWFVDGYESIRPFPSSAERDLELMIALRHGTSALWLLDRHEALAMPADQFERVMAYRVEEIESSLAALDR